jgi:hypothetical protein
MERMGAAVDAGDDILIEELMAEPVPRLPEPTRCVQPLDTASRPAAPPTPLEREALMARISAEIYAHLARGILPMCAESVASIRLEAIEQRRELLGELERIKELERTGRQLAAREERAQEAEAEEELEKFREELVSMRQVE